MKASKHIRDHVSTYGQEIKKATAKKFGINSSLIIRAVNGDEKALKEIGDMGRTGERLAMAMPTIRDNLLSYIEGTTEYNTALADIYKSGSKGAQAIDKAASDVTLENTRYNNLIDEYKTSLFAKLESENQRHDDAMDVIELQAWVDSQMATVSENQRHDDAMDVIELQAWVDSQMATVNAKASLESISNKPFIAQMKADRDYEDKKIKHLLENGSDSDLSLIPKKHYSTNPLVKLWNEIRDMFN